MKAFFGILSALLVLALAAVGFGYYRLQKFQFERFGEGTRVITVKPNTGPKGLGAQLAREGLVSDGQMFYAMIRVLHRHQVVRAGEYELTGPLSPEEIFAKLAKGEVKTYRFTVPEGLRVDEIANIVGNTGLCPGPEFLALARDPQQARKAGVPGRSLEGYLFPDTYTVTRAAGCAGILTAMVKRFEAAWKQAQAQRLPSVTLDEKEAVTLASIIEKETAQAAERPHVSCVFHNRLRKGIPLATDPTVIYAVLLQNDFKWDGNLHRSDLERPHPYNTYRVKGLPPGPISNPGEAALEAALHPMPCEDLFFVSRNDHTHVFCPDLACHERNVKKWQIDYFRHKKGT